LRQFCIAVAAFLLLAPAALFAEDFLLDGKDINLYIGEDDATFYVADPSPDNAGLKYLLFKDVPATSYVTFIIEGNPYRVEDTDITAVSYLKESSENVVEAVYQKGDITATMKFMLTIPFCRR
jgi:hypothetical protein